jgi:hypothetical protein
MEKPTEDAMNDPQVGDRFSEMYNFWMYVVHRDGDTVVTMEGSPPCEFPNKPVTYTLDQFKSRFAYGNIPGYWVRLVDRENNVMGWYVP